ncbi:nuclear transport factor 2 family protein [Pseudonocardia xinjiangensis]|uniref:nuclear transport factor 2 family protein n=1 Tax=Pseudonocardia xinjiangensis TaxID=75289 RepID=UPI003D8AB266
MGENNVAIVLDYLDGLHHGDKGRMAQHLASDAVYWILPGTAFSGTHNKTDFLALVDNLLGAQSGPLELKIGNITAQDGRVAIVVNGRMPLKSGGTYDNVYHWLFTLREGKIVYVKEFFDTLAVWKAFGTPEQAAAAEAATA